MTGEFGSWFLLFLSGLFWGLGISGVFPFLGLALFMRKRFLLAYSGLIILFLPVFFVGFTMSFASPGFIFSDWFWVS